MTIKIETNYGLYFLKKRYDVDTCETFYDVYEEPLEDELNGNYVGEFVPSVFYDEDMSTEELEFFTMELEDFIINQ